MSFAWANLKKKSVRNKSIFRLHKVVDAELSNKEREMTDRILITNWYRN